MAQEIIAAPIPGKVINVNVEVGAQVNEGDTICEVESMKMEIPVVAPSGGTLKEILVAEGDAVTEGQDVAIMDG